MTDARPSPTTPDCTLLGFRLLVALLIAIHGWYRLSVGTSPAFGDWLATQGIPLAHAVASGVTIGEIIGSACLALGLCVRPCALLFMGIYLMGIVLVHAPEGWFVVGAGRNGMEYSVLLIGSLALVALRIRDPLWSAFPRR
jgi:putative oxidoreductase